MNSSMGTSPSFDKQALQREMHSINWWHNIDLGNGLITPGKDDTPARLPFVGIPEDLTGRSFLDIGAWDGFFSFEAERRGASRVLAIDEFMWSGKGWASKAGFDFAHRVLGSRVESMILDVYELSPDRVGGAFDVVFFSGVLYHLLHPMLALERVASVTKNLLILSTQLDFDDIDRPAIAFYPGAELNGDPTNWCGPNIPALRGMLATVGLPDTSVFYKAPTSGPRTWATLHAVR